MPCVAAFGIIDNLEEYDEHEYNPSKYHCTAIDDDFIRFTEGELLQDESIKEHIKVMAIEALNKVNQKA